MSNIGPTGLFPKGYRASGVVLDIAELPTAYGIGDVGPAALAWVDRLHDAGQSWWHALESTGSQHCDSPYRSVSSFAGNTLLISPDWLIEDGLLSPQDCACVAFPAGSIDYDVVVPFKLWLLKKAWNRFNGGTRKDLRAPYEQFRKKQAHWLEEYSLFRALKAKYKGAHYREWPGELAQHKPTAVSDAHRELSVQIDQVRFSQFILFRQTQHLKDYAWAKGMRLIGDLPFFVPADSSDAWANPELFVNDEKYPSPCTTDLVPVCFSSSEKLSSVSDPSSIGRVSYRWCVDRLRALLAHVDVARVDVPVLAAPWRSTDGAPANRFTKARSEEHPTEIGGLIVDGLAMDAKDCFAFREEFCVPEARVLRLAFNGRPDNPHLPNNYAPNSVVYTSIKGGAGTARWFSELPDHHRRAFWDQLKRSPGENAEVGWELIRLAWCSTAALALVPLPDLLNLTDDQINPGDVSDGHRRWCCSEEMLAAPAFYWLRELTRRSNRCHEAKSVMPSAPRRRTTRTKIEVAL